MSATTLPTKTAGATPGIAAPLIKRFDEIGIDDIPLVGGKNASLGEMRRELTAKGVPVPDGFAITAAASTHFVRSARRRDDGASHRQVLLDGLREHTEPNPVDFPGADSLEDCGYAREKFVGLLALGARTP